MKSNSKIPVILASTSPRRIELMKQVGFSVIVQSPSTDEKRKPGETPRAMVARLAAEKAESIAPHAYDRHGQAVIVAADTIVVAPDGKSVLGKPRDVAEAKKMLGMLAGKTHTVLTGYCVLSLDDGTRPSSTVRVVTSKVTMRKLSKADIARYVETGEPMDKAGAYGAQGIGMALIEKLSGSYTNVVGLPMSQLVIDLEKALSMPLLSWSK